MFKSGPSDPEIVIFSALIYRQLLAFYPTRFRRAYGPNMAQVFRDCCLSTYRQSGAWGMLALWALTLSDWFKTVLEEQLNRGTEMTHTKFIRLSGWALVLAAVSLLMSLLPEADKVLEGLYQTFGAPDTAAQGRLFLDLSEVLRNIPFPAAILLITLGLLGLRSRYGDRAGKSAKMALGIGILGGAVGVASYLGMAVGYINGRVLTNISMGVMFAGLFVFGLAALRKKLMPRGNGLPALAGIWWPILVIQAYVFPQVTLSLGAEFLAWQSIIIFSFISLFLAMLGYVLQANTPEVDKMAAIKA